jgi:hypothetical protein
VPGARVRTFIGRSRSLCTLCGTDGEHAIIESRNRRRLLGRDADVRRYLVCPTCGSRSEVTTRDGAVVDLRDPSA